MSPCYDPREDMGKDSLSAHHKRLEALIERMLEDKRVPREYANAYEAECRAHAADRGFVLDGTYWDKRGRGKKP